MPRQGDKSKALAILCLVGVMLCWGTIPVFLRYFHLSTNLDAWTVNGVRYSVGALFWLPFVFLLLGRRPEQLLARDPRNVWRDALFPTVANVLAQVGYAMSPYHTSAATIGFVLRLSFLSTMLFGFWSLTGERRLARKLGFWAGAAVSLSGVVLMFAQRLRGGGGDTLLGLVLVTATAAGFGAYAVSVRKRMAGYPIRLSFGVISLYTAAVLLVLMLLFGKIGELWRLQAKTWPILIGSALLGIAFGHVLYYRAILRLGPVVSSGLLLATPFITYLWAALFLEERMTAMQLAGGLLVIVGGAFLVKAKAQSGQDSASPGTADGE